MSRIVAIVLGLAACGGAAPPAPPPAKPVAAVPAAPKPTPPPMPLPPECEAFNVAATMLMACEATPQNIRDALQENLNFVKEHWNKGGVGPTPEELRDIVQACATGADAMNKHAIDEGC